MWNGVHLGDRAYQPSHVNTLRRSIARHSPNLKHRFICIADSSAGFDKDVEVVITPEAARSVGKNRSPEGHRFPSCYRRLWMFSEEAKELGDRVLLLDIDLVPTGEWDAIVNRSEDFVGWRPFRDWGTQQRIGGGIYLLRTGTRTHVWTNFKGAASIQRARAAGFRGSDQAWMSYCLAGKEAIWGKDSGIYSIRDMKGTEARLPSDARLVQFNGPVKPWNSTLPWVREHFR